MALFKILRGTSTSLSTVPLTDGFAYFTPDDGRFYIDAALSTAPAHYISQNNGVYRIELRPSTADLATLATRATGDSAGRTIQDTYIADLSFDYATSTMTITKAGGATSTISIPPLIQVKS